MGACVSKNMDEKSMLKVSNLRCKDEINKSLVSPFYEDGFTSVLHKTDTAASRIELISLFDYTARTHDEISLHKKDILVALNQKWFVPKLSRKESERLLLKKENKRGTFLIRASETKQGTLTLSMKDQEKGRAGNPNLQHDVVKHFRIRIDQDSRYYITTRNYFQSLKELVKYYSESANGLCFKLTQPCSRPTPITADLSIQTKNKWEISQKSIRLLEKLGAGQFGEVWRAKWNNTTEVAVKTLKPGSMSKEEFLKEARIMKSVQHPKLVRLYAVCLEDPIYIVTELMPLGSLLEYLRDGLGKTLELEVLIDIMEQIAVGMSYLERNHFIHRDLAARNILVGDNNSVKIADFGLARMVEDCYDAYTAAKGTKFPIKWTAPEAALTGRFTVKSDVWSFGIVLYEIVTRGQIPYPAFSNTETLTKVAGGYRMQKPAVCPESIYNLMLETWHEDPEKRPSFQTLSEYFEDFTADQKGQDMPLHKKASIILDQSVSDSPRFPNHNSENRYPLAVV